MAGDINSLKLHVTPNSDFLYSTLKEYKQKFGTLKRIQQTEKKKNAHLLEEARRREEDISTDSMHLKVSIDGP